MAIGDLYDAGNVVVGQAACMFADSNTDLPDKADANLDDPFDPTVFGASWTQCGATDQGWKFSAGKNVDTINIEEQSTPVSTGINTQDISIQASLSEDISTTLELALNASSTDTAATASDPGYTEVDLTDDVLYYAVCLIATNGSGFPRWYYFPKATSLANTEVDFRRSSDKHMYAVSFVPVCATNDIKIIDFTAKATS